MLATLYFLQTVHAVMHMVIGMLIIRNPIYMLRYNARFSNFIETNTHVLIDSVLGNGAIAAI